MPNTQKSLSYFKHAKCTHNYVCTETVCHGHSIFQDFIIYYKAAGFNEVFCLIIT